MSLSDGFPGGLSYIEQVIAEGCSRPGRPMMIGRNHDTKTAVVFRPRCKTWSCPECARTNARLWEFKAINGAQQLIEAGKPLSMVTITNLGKMQPKSSLFVLPKQWHKLFYRAKRKAGQYEYICFPEKTKRNIIHLHLLATYDLGTRWWKDNGAYAGFGYRNEESDINSAFRAGWYAAKYLAKSAETTYWPPGFHRVRTSRSWPHLPALEKRDGWEFIRCGNEQRIEGLIPALQKEGFGIALANHRTAWGVVNGDESMIESGVLWA